MRTTTLSFFRDDANGEYGIAHENAIHNNTPFNAFWDALGIFHDVWEHYFEDNHKYFEENYAFNVAGEIAAMGHFYYYTNELGLSARSYRNSRWGSTYIADTRNIIGTTNSEMEEAIAYGYTRYGNELTCNIPYISLNLNNKQNEPHNLKHYRNTRTGKNHRTTANFRKKLPYPIR